jgi:adenylylsulfate kinase-like enzyme
MTLVELHDVMGDRIRVTLNNNLTAEERTIENEQTKIIIGVAKQMINNGKLILEYEKALAQAKTLEHSVLADMIGE